MKVKYDLEWRRYPKNNKYWVSNEGNVLSMTLKSKCALVGSYKTKYRMLRVNGVTNYIHRMVYETFKGPIPKGMEINHIDGNRQNNSINNLEICTPLGNKKHSKENGLTERGEKRYNSKLKEEDIGKIFEAYRSGLSMVDVGKLFNVNKSIIHRILLGHSWGHVKGIDRTYLHRTKTDHCRRLK